MVIDMDLYFEIKKITGKDYEIYALTTKEEDKIMITNIKGVLEDLVEAYNRKEN